MDSQENWRGSEAVVSEVVVAEVVVAEVLVAEERWTSREQHGRRPSRGWRGEIGLRGHRVRRVGKERISGISLGQSSGERLEKPWAGQGNSCLSSLTRLIDAAKFNTTDTARYRRVPDDHAQGVPSRASGAIWG